MKEGRGFLEFSKDTKPEVIHTLLKELKPYKVESSAIHFYTKEIEELNSVFEKTIKSVKIE